MYTPILPQKNGTGANSIIGLSGSGTPLEYKELIAGAGVSIAHTVETIVITVTASGHVHNINDWATETIVSGDFVPFWDITLPAAPKKITFTNFEAALTHDNFIAGTIASHDTTATGANLTALTDDSMADALHRHSELSASDGSPDPALQVDAIGRVGIGRIPTAYFDLVTTDVNCEIICETIGSGNINPQLSMRSLAGRTAQVDFWSGGTRQWLFGYEGTTNNFTIQRWVGSWNTTTFNITPNNEFGLGTETPDARFEVSTEATEGKQAVTIDQNDEDQPFIDYQGTSAASVANNVSTWKGGNTVQGFILNEIGGVEYWMPYYNAPSLASERFYPRVISQTTLPTAGLGATQIDSSEFAMWIDTDDSDHLYIIYNQGGTVKQLSIG